MSLQVVITAEAEANISANAEWWAENRSVDQARRWKEDVKLQIEGIKGDARESKHCHGQTRNLRCAQTDSGTTHRVIFSVLKVQ